MAFLEKFSAEERARLVSLPYRAGVWVSTIDRSGGVDSGVAERDVLEKIIAEKASGMFESAFVHEIMSEIYAHKNDWPQWGADVQDVPGDCEKAIALIAQKLSAHDVKSYSQNLMYIAVGVARAFREFDTGKSSLVMCGKVRSWLGRLTGVKSTGMHETSSVRNVSYAEDKALASLSRALGMSNDRNENQ